MKLSVIIPVFNEEKTIGELLARVLAEKTPKEIIVVDDGSTDGTREEIKRFRNRDIKNIKGIKVFFHGVNQGKGAAVRKGIKNATGEILIIQDADLEYNPRLYSCLAAPILSGKTEVVYGTRLKSLKFRLWGKDKTPLPLHYLANRFLSALTNLLYGSNISDMETGYKVMSKKVYPNIHLEANRFEIEPEMTAKILRAGYKIWEVSITTKPRGYQEGKKIKARDALVAIWALFRYRWRQLC